MRVADLLRQYGIKGTFYLCRSYRDDPLEKSDIRSLDVAFEIGAHTLTHPDLRILKKDAALTEISGSKGWLEETIGHSIGSFCYPYGKHDVRVRRLVRQAGFVAARCLAFEVSPPSDAFAFGVSVQASNGSPLQRMEAFLKYRTSPRSLLDWGQCARLLFDFVKENGGVWHLWGHSWEIDRNSEWKV
jgi:peptidoglycan/xylan/chitin deacetylase (PgdA/CDA1 family)